MPKRLLLAASILALVAGRLGAEPVPRAAPVAGSVVTTRIGEEIELVEAPVWRSLEVLQDVKAGDVVRTNALGGVAILFADQTQLRLGRNAVLVVHAVGPGGARLELTAGRLFGRTPRGGADVQVETPAATAAIRGTDWSMQVEGDRSALLVLDGAVEFSNPQGAVTVTAGEAATATLGQAPSKVVVVSSDLREQMLVNLSLRGAFEALSPYALNGPALRAAAARIDATPPAGRSAEDRVLAAEIALDREGRAAALAAVASARALPLTPAQRARLTVVEAVVAGAEGRYAEAARLFDAAAPGLSGEQATAARYQGYFARSLADPSRALPAPAAGGDRISVVGQAIIALFLEGPDAGYAIMQRAAPRFRDDPAFLATLAEAALLVGDWDGARAAADRAAALAPDDPEVLSARANVRANVDYNLEGALSDLERALEATPASSDLWNDLGLLQGARDAEREAEAAFLRAIALDPEDPVARANYAILLLDMDRLAEADAQIEAAFAADPSFELGYLARGRAELQRGDAEAAIGSLLRATTANPAYSNGLLVLGAAYAEDGAYDLADQAFGNAARLDPRDPVVSQYRSSLATFLYQADDAIRFARDSVRQTRARGGDYASVGATRVFGSTLGSAYRTLSLGAWGDYWSDMVFNPFDPGGYFDRAISGRGSPLLTGRTRDLPGPDPTLDGGSFSNLLQGLLLDPLALVGPSLRPSFLRSPFTELAVAAGPMRADGDPGLALSGGLQRLAAAPVPYALALSASYDTLDPSYGDEDETGLEGVLGLGLQVTPFDRVVAFANGARATGGLAFPDVPDTRRNTSEGDSISGFLGWSHTFGHRNVLNAAISANRLASDARILTAFGVPPFALPAHLDLDGDRTTLKAGIAHMWGRGGLTLRVGAEGGEIRDKSRLALTVDLPDGPARQDLLDVDATQRLGRAWIDVLAEPGDRVRVEAALFATYLEDAPDEAMLAPRLGLAWTPRDGHWLRLGLLRERPALEGDTLAPIGVLGLDPIDMPSGSGRVDVAIVRWDAEWTGRFFTSLEYQRQEIEDLSISVDNSLTPVAAPDATLDQLQASANLWIAGGFGVFGSVARNWSDAAIDRQDGAIPFVPDVSARFGVTHVNPRRFTVTLAETYLGERASQFPGVALGDAWITDLTGGWESESRRFAVTAGVYNVFDAEYDIAPGLAGVGRTLAATLEARF